ncbi:MAG: LacI family DNA-binding transcriptional regulator [Marvinbryantia sp.]|uniref:LacI family DNA-binding transcriptional regulator n=1 Tax=Marvinbryantia sp. TaxID=2496532 RepID=UPI0025ED8978|nr:LacI family DNA-binding transcriptional regulator [uncultured Marvinbryantia sp.]
MTVREVAKRAGVSPATVSRYFTGAENVSEPIAAKIREVLGEEEQAERGKNGPIVLVVPQKRMAFYTELMQRFMEHMPLYDFQIILLPVSRMEAGQLKQMLTRVRAQGLILFEEDGDFPIHELAHKMGIPVVLCGEASVSMQSGAYIHVNDVAAAYEGTKYLLSLGHKKIVFFTNYGVGINASYQRMIGCARAMEEAGLSFAEPYVRYGTLIYENGYRYAQELVREKLDFTAIFAFSDEMACGAVRGLQDLGVRVPEEVSVLGFDDLPVAEQLRPQLTTMHQPLDDFVRCTVEFFRKGNMVEVSREIMLPHSMIVRGSCLAREEKENEKGSCEENLF